MKAPPPEDAERCLELRRQSKRGARLHPDDPAFVRKMYDLYSSWYGSTERQIFLETAPFGSRIAELEKNREAGDEDA
jgi:hypothetical protein